MTFSFSRSGFFSAIGCGFALWAIFAASSDLLPEAAPAGRQAAAYLHYIFQTNKKPLSLSPQVGKSGSGFFSLIKNDGK
jgi:hypothetical protein